MQEKRNIEIFIDKRIDGITQSNNTFSNINEKDFYITIALFQTSKLTDQYIETYLDDTKYTIPRQFFNPYFIECYLFNSINNNQELINKAKLNNITINT